MRRTLGNNLGRRRRTAVPDSILRYAMLLLLRYHVRRGLVSRIQIPRDYSVGIIPRVRQCLARLIVSLEFIAYREVVNASFARLMGRSGGRRSGQRGERGQFERRRRSCENERVSSLCPLCPLCPLHPLRIFPLNMFVCLREGRKFPSRQSNIPAGRVKITSRWVGRTLL